MKAIGIGRLTKDIELKHSQSGTAFLSNSIACDRKFKREGEPTADFHNIKVFGKTAEAMEKYLHKGSKIYVEGNLQNEEYTDKNGVKRQITSIYVTEWEFADSKGEKTETKADVTELNITEQLPFDLPFS